VKILFVLRRPGIAGVETLALRLISELIQGYGDTVGLLLIVKTPSKSFYKTLHSQCKVYSVFTPGTLAELNKEKWDIVYGFETFGLLFGYWFLSRLNHTPKICVGGYHPLEYSWQPEKKSFLKNFILKHFNRVPRSNLIFMNEEVLNRAKNNLVELNGAHVIPLPIDSERFAQVQRHPNRTKIVSLGRLVGFKTYNLQMIEAVHEFNKRGIRLNYEVYGDGELRAPMMQLIAKYGLQNQVKLMGSLPYEQIEKSFVDAYCFVGCGTALAEASAAGLPSLVTIEAAVSPGETYGFFTEISGFNVGEFNPTWPQHSLVMMLEKLLSLTPAQYESLAHEHIAKARGFNLHTVTGMYRQVFQAAHNTPDRTSSLALLNWTVIYFFYKVVDKFGIKTPLQNRYIQKYSNS
jgi:glycosyltransferase involved in cell wall biosynthesis